MTTIRTCRFLTVILALATLSGLGCAANPHTGGVGQNDASSADRALEALLDAQLAAMSKADPIGASMRGEHSYDRLLPDRSAAARADRLRDQRDRLDQLQQIDRAALSPANRLNAELLEWELNDALAVAPFDPWQMPITQQNGVQIMAAQWADSLSFTQWADYEAYLERLRAFPTYVDQVMANMSAGLAVGRTPPRLVLGDVPNQIAAHATNAQKQDPTTHAMYAPFRDLPQDDALAAAARDAILTEVIPAFEALEVFVRETYLPGARTSIAAIDLPDGEAYYANRLHHFTTTGMTAREIHELGLREVARIRAEMMDTIARSDFPEHDALAGDALFDAFVSYLRNDPRFYFDDPEALLSRYRDIAKQIDSAMPSLFGVLPRLSYGVRAMPEFMSASAPTAYYYPGSLELGVAGNFVANTTQLNQRPRYEMISLTMHEAVPGHHHQIALAQELEADGLHEWRTTLGYTAFVEGWALYAERLGLEIGDASAGGVYADPYDDFGRLSYEMWRALRLVVDPGMHAFGWTREQAIEFMLENSALSRANIESEVDRYIAWPGQATGYKIGELKIRELRDRAEGALGDDFDIRTFHDVVLAQGAIPLDVLERRVNAWIEANQR